MGDWGHRPNVRHASSRRIGRGSRNDDGQKVRGDDETLRHFVGCSMVQLVMSISLYSADA